MSFKASLCRIAFSLLERGYDVLGGSRSLSSMSTRTVAAARPKDLVPPFNLKAVNVGTKYFDPELNKSPLNILDVPFTPSLVRIPGILDKTIGPWVPPSHPPQLPSDRLPAPVEDPTVVIEKQAARLIVIRRRKMRRHKLKKLRIRMKFEWAKRRQRRELKKEKAFQAELMGQIKESKQFDVASYVSKKIEKANEVPLPKMWKGKRLPEFVIKDLIREQKEKAARSLATRERRARMPKTVAEYKI